MNCTECILRFQSWGSDPRVKSGKYHLSSCDYCSIDYSQITSIEQLEEVHQRLAQISKKLSGQVEELSSMKKRESDRFE